MACYDTLVTVRGLCDSSTNALYYLDRLGISLKGASNAADERSITGRALIDQILEQAWDDTYSDITFEGLSTGKVQWGDSVGKVTEDEYEAEGGGWKTITFTIDDNCPLLQAFVNSVTSHYLDESPDVNLQVRLIDGDTTTDLHTAVAPSGGKKYIIVNRFIENQTFQIQINTTDLSVNQGTLAHPNSASEYMAISSDDSKNWGMVVDMSLVCRPSRYLCKFNGSLAKPVWYKAAALMYKEYMMTTRLHDYLTVKLGVNQSETMSEIAYLDSSINPYQYGEEGKKEYPDGKYQQELAKIKIPIPHCSCCLECRGNSYAISIP